MTTSTVSSFSSTQSSSSDSSLLIQFACFNAVFEIVCNTGINSVGGLRGTRNNHGFGSDGTADFSGGVGKGDVGAGGDFSGTGNNRISGRGGIALTVDSGGTVGGGNGQIGDRGGGRTLGWERISRPMILIESARFGRNDTEGAVRCGVPLTRSCDFDVQYPVTRTCGGKRRCSFVVDASFFGDPCGHDEFLRVEYRCLADSLVQRQCTIDHHQPSFPSNFAQASVTGSYIDRGYVASPNYPSKYYLDVDCKWTLKFQRQQSIRITLYDFELDVKRNGRCRDYLALIATSSTNNSTLTARNNVTISPKRNMKSLARYTTSSSPRYRSLSTGNHRGNPVLVVREVTSPKRLQMTSGKTRLVTTSSTSQRDATTPSGHVTDLAARVGVKLLEGPEGGRGEGSDGGGEQVREGYKIVFMECGTVGKQVIETGSSEVAILFKTGRTSLTQRGFILYFESTTSDCALTESPNNSVRLTYFLDDSGVLVRNSSCLFNGSYGSSRQSFCSGTNWNEEIPSCTDTQPEAETTIVLLNKNQSEEMSVFAFGTLSVIVLVLVLLCSLLLVHCSQQLILSSSNKQTMKRTELSNTLFVNNILKDSENVPTNERYDDVSKNTAITPACSHDNHERQRNRDNHRNYADTSLSISRTNSRTTCTCSTANELIISAVTLPTCRPTPLLLALNNSPRAYHSGRGFSRLPTSQAFPSASVEFKSEVNCSCSFVCTSNLRPAVLGDSFQCPRNGVHPKINCERIFSPSTLDN